MSLETTFRQHLMKYLAMIAISVGAGEAEAAEQLRKIPDKVVEEVLDELSDEDWDKEDLPSFIRLLSRDPRAAIRRRAAELAFDLDESMSLDDVEPLFREQGQRPDQFLLVVICDPLISQQVLETICDPLFGNPINLRKNIDALGDDAFEDNSLDSAALHVVEE